MQRIMGHGNSERIPGYSENLRFSLLMHALNVGLYLWHSDVRRWVDHPLYYVRLRKYMATSEHYYLVQCLESQCSRKRCI